MKLPLPEHLRERLPALFTEKVFREQDESESQRRRRRRVVAATSLAGAGLLGVSLSTRPNSPAFYGLTLGTAATWTVGSVVSGRLHRGRMPPGYRLRQPTVIPVLTGVGAFGVFYGCALVCKRIPVLNRAISSVLRYADQGSTTLVLVTTLANGAAEEVFFRGALYTAVGLRRPVLTSTAVYMLATSATRNPALMLASVVMGALFGLQRRASGGIQAPMLTHLTWSTLMLRYLPPLFQQVLDTAAQQDAVQKNAAQKNASQAGEARKAPNPSSNRSTSAEST